MKQAGIRFPIITLGQHGVAYLDADEPKRLECTLPNPRIAVGAGDALTGALAVALERGKRDVDALRVAVSVAAAYVSASPLSDLQSEASRLEKHSLHYAYTSL